MNNDQYLMSLGIKPDQDSRDVLFEVQQESEEIGVLSNKTKENRGDIRDHRGKWLPGARVPGAGRKSRQYERDMVEAIKRVLTPENIEKYLNIGLDLAVDQKSTRGIIAVLELGLAYGAGKPVQQVVGDSGKTELLEQLLSSDKPLLPPETDLAITQDKKG